MTNIIICFKNFGTNYKCKGIPFKETFPADSQCNLKILIMRKCSGHRDELQLDNYVNNNKLEHAAPKDFFTCYI